MNNTVYLDVGFEHLLNRVFGRNRYHGAAGNHDKTSWKNILTKLFTSLEKHIDANIQDDIEQENKLKQNIDTMKSVLHRNESINELNIHSVRVLFDICFQLLGDKIDNTDKKIVNHSSHYKLDKKRTITYHSNNLQKFKIVCSKAGTAKFLDAGFPNKNDLWDLYLDEMNNNPDKFIKWFKDEYPNLYLTLF